MILNWKNPDDFKRHLEEMKSFRRAHDHLIPEEEVKSLRRAHAQLVPGGQLIINRASPVPLTNTPPCRTGLITRLTDKTGKAQIAPIWKIELPKGSQN